MHEEHSRQAPSAEKLEALRRALEDFEKEYSKRPAPDQQALRLEEKARKFLGNSLNAGPRTRSQLQERLERREIPASIYEPLLDRFEEVGLIDDAAYARTWVEHRSLNRAIGPRALREELQRKGIAAHLIEEALSGLGEDESAAEAGRQMARAKLAGVIRRAKSPDLNNYTERQKILQKTVAALLRKGHSPSDALAWARQALEEEEQTRSSS